MDIDVNIEDLKDEYSKLRKGKDELLLMIYQSEIPEMVYNSNAIENSTLTLKETEKILLEQELMSDISVRELFEAKNLARVIEYLFPKPNFELTIENLELLHQMLLGGINDQFAGHLRRKGEYVKVGNHIAPSPVSVKPKLITLFDSFYHSSEQNIAKLVANFHLEFEHIHPFCDGNGRIGRVLINICLAHKGFPPIIIPAKTKFDDYYQFLSEYNFSKKDTGLYKFLTLYMKESLNKRIAYLKGSNIVKLSEYAKKNKLNQAALTNKAKRQTIPAFRINGTWMIGEQITL